MSNIGFVIGNGSSRKQFDLRQVSRAGTTYGMNAVHREFYPDNLVCIRRSHLIEAINWNLENRLYLHTSNEMVTLTKNPNLELVPPIPFVPSHINEMVNMWKTGSYGVLIAAERHDIVICFGMDFAGDNIYRDSDNYWRDRKTDYAPHLQQVGKIIDHFSDTQFIFIQDIDTAANALDNKPNVSYDTYNNAVKMLLT